MAKKTRKPINNSGKTKNKKDLEAANQFKYILLFAFGLLLFFIVLIKGKNLWQILHDTIFGLFGFLSFFIGILNMLIAILFSSKVIKSNFKSRFYQFAVLFILICSEIQTYAYEEVGGVNVINLIKRTWQYGVIDAKGGGVVGEIFSLIFRTFLGKNAAIAVLWILIFVFFLIITSSTLFGFFKTIFVPVKKVENKIRNLNIPKKFNIDIPLEDENDENIEDKPKEEEKLDFEENLNFFKQNQVNDKEKDIDTKTDLNINLDKTEKESSIKENIGDIKENKKDFKSNVNVVSKPLNESLASNKDQLEEAVPIDNLIKKASKDYSEKINIDLEKDEMEDKNFDGYRFPPLSFLNNPKNLEDEEISSELKLELTSNASMLIETLASFGVKAQIINICRGPSVTRYEIQPSAGVKLSKITNLADDISLNLAAGGVMIAPVPDKKSIVGIEVPNKKKHMVYLKEVISTKEFINASSSLTFALGKDIAGNVKLGDIAKMPHILIAGATGSGKSVCVNSLIVSLIYKSSPKDVRLLMIDPKVVELGVYNGIPHLLVPVVTEPKKASGALSWAVSEMMKRYKMFAETGVRDMKNFNLLVDSKKRDAEGKLYEKMPQIVIIIDELADLMMAASREVESSICRLAQMARAAGMHLVIATQRPSVDVITGLIKANIPSRIAFTVSSQIDSRTIIDMVGAEKLLGKGDMLYYPMEERKPIRVQGCFLTDKEIEKVVEFIKNDEKVSYSEDIIKEIDRQALKNEKKSSSEKDLEEKDPMIISAIETVVEGGQASTSFLQRKLKLGYSRAARIMDEMENMGIVGPQTGSKPREILISKEEFLQMYVNNV